MDFVKQNDAIEFEFGSKVKYNNPELGQVTAPKIAEKPKWLRFGRFGLELILINVAFIFAYAMRFNLHIGGELAPEFQTPLSDYIIVQIAYTLVLFTVLHIKGFYRMARMSGLMDEVGKILGSSLIAVGIIMIGVYISRPVEASRLMFVYLLPITLFLLTLERITVRRVYQSLWFKGIGVSNTIVIGATDVGMRLMHSIVQLPTSGYRVIGYVDDEERFSKWTLPARYANKGKNKDDIKMLGATAMLPEIVKTHNVRQVFIALPSSRHEVVDAIIRQCRELGVSFTLVPDIYQLKLNSLKVQEINGVPLIDFKENQLTGWNYVMKRASDITLALIAILCASIPMLIVAIAIKLDSKGPILFRQTRVGKDGKLFKCLKFRSMHVNAEQMLEALRQHNQTGGITFKMANDPRRTRVGKIIRRTSLDELPQFFNILFGEMSFVGPRPPIVKEVEKYENWHYRRLEVTPGLSGLWQVSGRSNLSYEEMVKLDIYYAEHWSLWLDVKIIAKTLPAVLKGDGAF